MILRMRPVGNLLTLFIPIFLILLPGKPVHGGSEYEIKLGAGSTVWQTEHFERSKGLQEDQLRRSLPPDESSLMAYFMTGQVEQLGVASDFEFFYRSDNGLNLFYDVYYRSVDTYYTQGALLYFLAGSLPNYYQLSYGAADLGGTYDIVPETLGIGGGVRYMSSTVDSSFLLFNSGFGYGVKNEIYSQTGPFLRAEFRHQFANYYILKAYVEAYAGSGKYEFTDFQYIPGDSSSSQATIIMELGTGMKSYRSGGVVELENLFKVSDMVGLTIGLRYEMATVTMDRYNSLYLESPSSYSFEQSYILNRAYNATYLTPVYRKKFKDEASDLTFGVTLHFFGGPRKKWGKNYDDDSKDDYDDTKDDYREENDPVLGDDVT